MVHDGFNAPWFNEHVELMVGMDFSFVGYKYMENVWPSEINYQAKSLLNVKT